MTTVRLIVTIMTAATYGAFSRLEEVGGVVGGVRIVGEGETYRLILHFLRLSWINVSINVKLILVSIKPKKLRKSLKILRIQKNFESAIKLNKIFTLRQLMNGPTWLNTTTASPRDPLSVTADSTDTPPSLSATTPLSTARKNART